MMLGPPNLPFSWPILHGCKMAAPIPDITSMFKSGGRREVSTLSFASLESTLSFYSPSCKLSWLFHWSELGHMIPPPPLPYKYLWESEYLLSTLWSRGQQNLKTETVNMLGFADHTVSATATQPCLLLFSQKVVSDSFVTLWT